LAPRGPCGPVGPETPGAPRGPVGPVGQEVQVGPLGPVGPEGISQQVVGLLQSRLLVEPSGSLVLHNLAEASWTETSRLLAWERSAPTRQAWLKLVAATLLVKRAF
jgi:hypothetical protein